MIVNLVPEGEADFYSGYLGEHTPLAEAILGRPAGSLTSYYANGLQRVKILSVTPFDPDEARGAADDRKAAFQQAVTDAERTSAIVFASSYTGK